jgi:hypothetical protein
MDHPHSLNRREWGFRVYGGVYGGRLIGQMASIWRTMREGGGKSDLRMNRIDAESIEILLKSILGGGGDWMNVIYVH